MEGEFCHDAILQLEEVLPLAVHLCRARDGSRAHIDDAPGDPEEVAEMLVPAGDEPGCAMAFRSTAKSVPSRCASASSTAGPMTAMFRVSRSASTDSAMPAPSQSSCGCPEMFSNGSTATVLVPAAAGFRWIVGVT